VRTVSDPAIGILETEVGALIQRPLVEFIQEHNAPAPSGSNFRGGGIAHDRCYVCWRKRVLHARSKSNFYRIVAMIVEASMWAIP
jgi:hypothetical protein